MSSARKDMRSNVSNWTLPILHPPITAHAIVCAAGGANPKLLERVIASVRRASGRCNTEAARNLIPSGGRAWLQEADELRAAAEILERLK